ncbi:hypothetical protein [Moraxella canis]|uniref:hypothetical protein n=1 Tax=Moraxella canis TaxID=90239 RepID=UPI00066996EC|nr:hypothetical protein [Moraxella canis]
MKLSENVARFGHRYGKKIILDIDSVRLLGCIAARQGIGEPPYEWFLFCLYSRKKEGLYIRRSRRILHVLLLTNIMIMAISLLIGATQGVLFWISAVGFVIAMPLLMFSIHRLEKITKIIKADAQQMIDHVQKTFPDHVQFSKVRSCSKYR